MRSSNQTSSTRPDPRERGTVLLMVVGVLALLSIIAVVYAAIGRADRITSSALVRQSQADTVIDAIADYHANVIRDDLFETVELPGWVNTTNPTAYTARDRFLWRETWDYPSISRNAYGDEDEQPNGDSDPRTEDPFRFNPAGRGTDPFLATSVPTLLPNGGNRGLPTQNLDLQNLSAVAPDGLPVNLHNLRNNFDAEHGIDDGEMNYGALVYRRDGTAESQVPNARNLATPARYFGAAGGAFAFAPATDPDWDPGDREFRRNSFADTDGDHMMDARWWEPVDGYESDGARLVIPSDREYRYFIATRIEDLSARINVNTAWEMDEGPTSDFPVGMTPASVDLRRFLTMADTYRTNRSASNRPGTTGYDRIWPDDPFSARPLSPRTQPADYTQYDVGGGGLGNAYAIGNEAFEVLAYARTFGAVPTAIDEDRYASFVGQPFDAELRYVTYEPLLLGSTGVNRIGAGTGVNVFSTALGIESELELRTFNRLNDPGRHSILETAVAGVAFDTLSDATFDPLRTNRPVDVERDYLDADRDGVLDPAGRELLLSDLRQHLTTVSAARRFVPRPIDSVAEGAVAGTPGSRTPSGNRIGVVDADRFEDIELPFRPAPILGEAQNINQQAIRDIYERYFRALAPFHDRNAFLQNRELYYSSMVYGGDIMLVARLAAHMTVNLIDGVDTADDVKDPTIATLELRPGTGEPSSVLQWDPGTTMTMTKLGDRYAVAGGDRTYAESLGQIIPDYLTVYGNEAQPFITEVVNFAIFTDAPAGSSPAPFQDGGDDEYAESLRISPDPLNPVDVGVTINFKRELGNPDFVAEFFGFQLANPFDEPITLSAGEDGAEFYVEHDGRVYPIQEVNDTGDDPQQITLAARSYRTFYVLNLARRADVQNRFEDVLNGADDPYMDSDPNTDELDDVINSVFGADAIRIRPYERPVTGTGQLDSLPDPILESGVIRFSRIGQSRSVRLWKVDGDAGAYDVDEDLLVDRLHNPGQGPNMLVYNISSDSLQGEEIAGSVAGDEDSVLPEDNTGYTTIVSESIRRPNWAGSAITGVLPPWAYDYPGQWNKEFSRPDTQDGATLYEANRDFHWETFANMLEWVDREQEPIRDVRVDDDPDTKSGVSPGLNRSQYSFQQVAMELHRRSSSDDPLFTRAADMLLPLAVGPSRSYFPGGSTGNRDFDLNREWMTFGEALAIAADYDRPGFQSVLDRVGEQLPPNTSPPAGSGPTFRRKLDHGRLVIDDWVPFIDANGNGGWDVGEEAAGLGIPLALNVLSEFAGFGPTRVDNAVAGLININTAPLPVLRTLPMLNPSPVQTAWWPTNYGGDFDIAAMLVAYRDRLNYTASNNISGVVGQNGAFMDVANFNRADDPAVNTRPNLTGIPALYETLPGDSAKGFRTIGEILCARLVGNNGARAAVDHSVDRFGFDSGGFVGGFGGANINVTGIESVTYENGGANVTDGSFYDYDEKLAIANAVINSISVRSDTFCVWFKVHGYRSSDVSDLENDEDPMVPSIERRFVMIVDRSNVVSRSDEPRILLFREVPL